MIVLVERETRGGRQERKRFIYFFVATASEIGAYKIFYIIKLKFIVNLKLVTNNIKKHL